MEMHIEDGWSRVRAKVRVECGETVYRSWMRPLSLESVQGGTVCLMAPTSKVKDWVLQNYKHRLVDMWRAEDGTVQDLTVLCSTNAAEDVAIREEDVFQNVSAPLDPRCTFENFVVDKSNELAFTAAQRVAEADEVPFNPLFFYGGVGLGKTHLMHAIAWHIRTHSPHKRVVYLSAEKFMYQFVRALRYKDTMAFKDLFRAVDLLMVDDVQFIAGKNSTQEEFFHTFNALVDHKRQVIVSSDKQPASMDGIEERMKSRLGWGLVVQVHKTTYELRLGILQARADALGISLAEDVLDFLAHHIVSNVRELEGALNILVAHRGSTGEAITLELTRACLRETLYARNRRIRVEDIQKYVAQHFDIKVSEMQSSHRSRYIARPRQVAMYLAKHMTTYSLPDIGRKFGGRDHTTVMHAVRRIKTLIEEDMDVREDVALLQQRLRE